ncbi:3D domain-containing protein [Bacillus cereus]|nr:3D domain-containing protein [Bacillus cereus]
MKKQIAAITLATTLGLSLQPIIGAAETNQNVQATQQNGWIEEGNGTWFFYDHGVKKTGWVLSNDKWYYLDGNAGGAMKTGWYQEGEKWFYLDPSAEGPKGAKKVGWAQVNGKWYYLDPTTDGSMKTGWIQVNGRWFYLDAEGAMKTGWVLSNDKWYYLDAEGVMKTGWYQDGEKWFYLDPSAEGAKKVGWAEVNGKWYYLDPTTDGSMKTGWVQVNGKWYYLDGNAGGAMKTGWNKIDGKMSYFKEDGQWIEGTERTVRATAYTNDPAENGTPAGQHVYTRMGDDLTANPNLKIIAVDPSVIPLGSKVYVEGYGPAEARDTGGAIKGNKIDVFVPSKEVSYNWGVKNVKIYVLPK